MGTPESYAWTVLLDGRTHQVVLEYERRWTGSVTVRLLLNGALIMTTEPTIWGLKFKVGKRDAKIRISIGGKPQQLLIDGKDSSDFDPTAMQMAPQYPQAPQQPHPPQPHTIYREHREHQVIHERQVVVVRCKFCATLTPADFATCTRCGAAKFS